LIVQLLAMWATQKAMQALGFNSGGSWGFQGVAMGGAFDRNGMMAFSQGGIVHSPTPFTFGGGRLGVMGEAGPEAIMPLSRGADGKLGVRGGGSMNVNVHNYAGAQIETQADGDKLDIIVRQVKDSLATDVLRGGNPFATTLERTYGVRR
jgi:lambda family phage tail tape measure protein